MFDAFNFPFFPLQLINEFHSSSLPTLETNGWWWWCWSEGWSDQLQRITRGWVFAHITSGDLLLGAEHCATSNQTKRHGGAEDDDGDLNVVVLTLAQMPQCTMVMTSAVCLSPPGGNYLLWKGCLCPTFKATYVPELFCLIFLQKLKCQQKHANSFCTEMSVCQSGTLCAPVNSNSQNQKITPDPTLVGRSQLKMYFPLTTQWNICQVQLLQFTNYFELSWSV